MLYAKQQGLEFRGFTRFSDVRDVDLTAVC
ncbi:hypothetical protein PCPL58_2699 [Pseudomonas cerasi]|jgi:hypothetical protein|uniref:Uncharacterized protein n=1 Tax=Pseudomonas cerasi TaxID=1583341 RepID=A0A193SQ40_9PSED|nr:hypothetical protein PCPL58_2699 [Pseudomonas cerasi]SOS20696.1 hypothetical protein PL963_02731 [Pseudomonas cerasi]